MPELPEVEVETIVRGLRATVGSRIEHVEVLDQRLDLPQDKIAGRAIEALSRRGKYIIIQLSDGGSLIVHLRMSGRLAIRRSTAEEKHTRFIIYLDDGGKIYFINPRRLGTAEYVQDGFPHELGVEPLSDQATADGSEEDRRAGEHLLFGGAVAGEDRSAKDGEHHLRG